MKKKYDPNFEMNVITIFPGEFYATRQKELITTLLGSCISVVLIDPVNKVSGMNHFMLPGTSPCKPGFVLKEGKYGIFAMELLINEMILLGGSKKYLRARIFGGGSVLQIYSGYTKSVSVENIRFVMKYLADEFIPIVSSDIGGIEGRKIYLFTGEEAAFVKKIEPSASNIIQHKALSISNQKNPEALYEKQYRRS